MSDPVKALGTVLEAYLEAEEARARWEGYGAWSERHRRLWWPLRLALWRWAAEAWLRAYMPQWRRLWREESRLQLITTGSGFALCSMTVSRAAYGEGVQSMVSFTPANFKSLVDATGRLMDPNDDAAAAATRKVRT